MRKVCPECGKKFTPIQNHQIYCSPQCSKKFNQRKKMIEKKERDHIKELLRKKCPVCGKEFIPNNNRQIYCSHTCKEKKNQSKSSSEPQDHIDIYVLTHPDTCIRCTRPREEGSDLCSYHIAIENRIKKKKKMDKKKI